MTDMDFVFLSFRLDATNQLLRNGEQVVPLRPKTVAVLRHFLEHPGQLISHADLSRAVWGAVTVSPQVLWISIRELRRVLGDTQERPQFIETVGRQGWRWIVPLNFASRVTSPKSQVQSHPFPPTSNTQHPAPAVVGREAELAQLHTWLDTARNGARQLVFVSGEPGIGKTALIDAFLSGIREQRPRNSNPALTDPRSPIPVPWISWGQCIEQYGPGEAYLPVLAALDQLCQHQDTTRLLDLLRRYAPLWLAQLPSLLDPAEQVELQRQLVGTTRERMLRELATLLEVVTAEQPLVLVLEDLHWADPSTVELLAYLARRRERARLLIVGTYRPIEVLTTAHPLHSALQELTSHGWCEELRLTGISEAAVTAYLAARLSSDSSQIPPSPHLVAQLYQQTEGHPFFLVHLVEDLLVRGLLQETEANGTMRNLAAQGLTIPATVRQLLTRQMARVTTIQRQVLAAASVAGAEFSAAAVAAALEADQATIEEQCEALLHRQAFLRPAGIEEWPDGTVAARYGFQHALGQQIWHEQMAPTRRQ
ncbi:MAG: AAA family ATPase [Deltaproteobacteria bacterium]|nr:AAA family ATPase [Deltaproteobacteria bacterium]